MDRHAGRLGRESVEWGNARGGGKFDWTREGENSQENMERDSVRGGASGFLEAEGSASCLRFALRGEQMTTT